MFDNCIILKRSIKIEAFVQQKLCTKNYKRTTDCLSVGWLVGRSVYVSVCMTGCWTVIVKGYENNNYEIIKRKFLKVVDKDIKTDKCATYASKLDFLSNLRRITQWK